MANDGRDGDDRHNDRDGRFTTDNDRDNWLLLCVCECNTRVFDMTKDQLSSITKAKAAKKNLAEYIITLLSSWYEVLRQEIARIMIFTENHESNRINIMYRETRHWYV